MREVGDPALHVPLERVEAVVRAHARGERAPPLVRFDRDDPRGARRARDPDREQADGAAAHHGDDTPGDVGVQNRVESVAERVQHRRQVVIDGIGDMDDVRRRNGDVLGDAPSRSMPMMRVSRHTCACPVPQYSQCPQTRCPSADTRSPTSMFCTSRPVSATSPMNSWPRVTGGVTRCCDHWSHCWMCRSVPQIPARRTLMSTSPERISGTGASHSTRPGTAPGLRIAFMETEDGSWMETCRVAHNVPEGLDGAASAGT